MVNNRAGNLKLSAIGIGWVFELFVQKGRVCCTDTVADFSGSSSFLVPLLSFISVLSSYGRFVELEVLTLGCIIPCVHLLRLLRLVRGALFLKSNLRKFNSGYRGLCCGHCNARTPREADGILLLLFNLTFNVCCFATIFLGGIFISRLLFTWVNPFLSVGFSRPLQKDGELYIFLSRT